MLNAVAAAVTILKAARMIVEFRIDLLCVRARFAKRANVAFAVVEFEASSDVTVRVILS